MNPAKLPRRAFDALRDPRRSNGRQRRLLVRAGLMGMKRVDRKTMRYVLTERGSKLRAILMAGKTGWTRLRWLLSPKGRYVKCFECRGDGLNADATGRCTKCEGVGELERRVA